jgi:hypothetical protein
MSAKSRSDTSGKNPKTIEWVTKEQGARLVDRQARKFLNMSGKEFVRQYRDGSIKDPHSLAVARVAILLPLVEK